MFERPQFLVIGPAKTGTSWLYEQLRALDGFNMPPAKEICFFNEVGFNQLFSDDDKHAAKKMEAFGVEPSAVNMEMTIKRFKNRHKKYRQKAFKDRQYLWGLLYQYLPRNTGLLSWYLYSKLFPQQNDLISGDISPPYFTLDESMIKLIAKRFPKLKIVMILREPVERAWSNIRMNYAAENVSTKMPVAGYIKTDSYRKRYLLNADYMQAITNWEKHFGPNRILYLFYDDLVKDPRKFLQQFLNFLRPGLNINTLVEDKIGSGIEMPMTDDIRIELLKNNLPQYRFLAQKFGPGSYPAQWLENAMEQSRGM